MKEQTFTITIAESEFAGDGSWKKQKTYGWSELSMALSDHKEGPKNGSCYVPGQFSQPRRLKSNAKTLEMVVFDIDSGHSFEDIEFDCDVNGFKCIITTTHSHMKTETKVSRDNYNKSNLSAEQYLIQIVKLLPEIAVGAKVTGHKENKTIIMHKPCPRIRVIVPLAKPWRSSDYPTIKEAEQAWASIVAKVADMLQLVDFDSCSIRLTQLYYFPRFPKNGPKPQSIIIEGETLDAFSLKESAQTSGASDVNGVNIVHNGIENTNGYGVIGNFNFFFTVDEILIKHDYTKVDENRYLYSESASGSPGVSLLEEGRKAFSHHTSDPLADGHAHDAFDCFRILDNEGNFNDAIENAKPRIRDRAITKLNHNHALTTIGSHAWIIYEKKYANDEGSYMDFLTLNAFRELYSNRTITVVSGEREKEVRWGNYWILSPNRREVGGVYFGPDEDKPGWYNTWKGIKLKPTELPQPEKWDLFRQHVEEIICSNNPILINYIWAWFADIVQNPGQKPGVALALRGGRGTGKGCFMKPFQQIVGIHGIQINNRSQLIGRFNGHLAGKVLAFIDEGYWSGDKQGEGVLKGLITEGEICVERKGVDAFRMKNYTRFVIASNNNWVVPAGVDERRFCVIDVSDDKAQNHTYFAPVFEQMENGGTEAFLRFLYDYDLTNINLRQAPKTKALLDQKLTSLKPAEAFWFEILKEGQFDFFEWDDNQQELPWDRAEQFITTQGLHNCYLSFCRDHKLHPDKSDAVMKDLFGIKGICPGSIPYRPSAKGRKRGYRIPPLDQCRLDFEKAVNSKGLIPW
jgi:hypothetical protein